MQDQYSRTQLLLGAEAMEKLHHCRVAVFGIGGVGGYTVEALARSGVGALDLIDDDKVCLTNLNRQIIATEKTVGMRKTAAAYQRFREINSECKLVLKDEFILMNTLEAIIPPDADYVIDCIDTVTAKLDVAEYCTKHGIKVISAMGAGNKLDPTKFTFTDIYQTTVCPLAKVMRRELKKRGVEKLMVLYSTEEALTPETEERLEDTVQGEMKAKRRTPGSVSFVPPVSGLLLAGYVIRQLTGK